MSYEDQDPWDGDCPGCREYEQERQRLVKENEDLRLACATCDATLTEISVERLRAERDDWRKAARAKDEALDLRDIELAQLRIELADAKATAESWKQAFLTLQDCVRSGRIR